MVNQCNEHGTRAKYAMMRMTLAQERMLLVMDSSDEWERAYKWAAAWGVAARIARSCPYVRNCPYHTDTCPKQFGEQDSSKSPSS